MRYRVARFGARGRQTLDVCCRYLFPKNFRDGNRAHPVKSTPGSIQRWCLDWFDKTKNRIPLGAEVRPRCGRDARVTVGRSDGAEAVQRASDAMITKVRESVRWATDSLPAHRTAQRYLRFYPVLSCLSLMFRPRWYIVL